MGMGGKRWGERGRGEVGVSGGWQGSTQFQKSACMPSEKR